MAPVPFMKNVLFGQKEKGVVIRMVTVSRTAAGSPAAQKGIRAGDILISINGHEIDDVLDYRFYLADDSLHLMMRRGGQCFAVTLPGGEIGLEFETYLMDAQRSCRNHCIFCFIDQLPAGLRESLYFKDDDSRLSFLFGNYITLTNLTEREVQRIIDLHISPVYVSVHTTDPDLRCKMMGNRFAGDSLRILPRMAKAGIDIHCQLVLCPGINDGASLKKTLDDLIALGDSLKSVAAVPVGLTKYRDGLYPLRTFTAKEAADVVDLLEAVGSRCEAETGNRRVYASDEFYLLAEKALPAPKFYGEYPQLENGVGMLSLLRQQFSAALRKEKASPVLAGGAVIATGYAAYDAMRELVDTANRRFSGLNARVVRVKNEFFGEKVTVAGLLTGRDLSRQLLDLRASRILISRDMLRREGDCFLDGVTVRELAHTLQTPVWPVESNGAALLDALLGKLRVTPRSVGRRAKPI